MPDNLEMRRKRALYRAEHRGTKEMDVLLGRYAVAELPGMADGALTDFEKFLEVPDQSLQVWILNGNPAADPNFIRLVSAVRAFHGLTKRSN